MPHFSQLAAFVRYVPASQCVKLQTVSVAALHGDISRKLLHCTHGIQKKAPLTMEYVPDVHAIHAGALGTAYVPDPQGVQEVTMPPGE